MRMLKNIQRRTLPYFFLHLMSSCPTKNEGALDRLFRILLGASLMLSAYFWLGGIAEIITILIGVIILLTGIMGFCGLYTLLRINTLSWKFRKSILWILTLTIIAVLLSGSYASAFFSKKIFLEDFATMDTSYKQALFTTGNTPADAADAFDQFNLSYENFQQTYTDYRPYFLKGDAQFSTDLQEGGSLLPTVRAQVASGDIAAAHLTLETFRPIFNEMLRRNGLSPLAVALVDFHDYMETMLDAASAKDAAGVMRAYPDADAKLTQVEALQNDDDIQTIRTALLSLQTAAEQNDVGVLPQKGALLKSSYVKVYMRQ